MNAGRKEETKVGGKEQIKRRGVRTAEGIVRTLFTIK